MYLSEWDANDGNVEHDAEKDVGEPYPDASDKEPKHIHKHVQSEHKNGTYKILVSAWLSEVDRPGLEPGTSRL